MQYEWLAAIRMLLGTFFSAIFFSFNYTCDCRFGFFPCPFFFLWKLMDHIRQLAWGVSYFCLILTTQDLQGQNQPLGLTQKGWLNLKRAGKLWTSSNLECCGNTLVGLYRSPSNWMLYIFVFVSVFFCFLLALFTYYT